MKLRRRNVRPGECERVRADDRKIENAARAWDIQFAREEYPPREGDPAGIPGQRIAFAQNYEATDRRQPAAALRARFLKRREPNGGDGLPRRLWNRGRIR